MKENILIYGNNNPYFLEKDKLGKELFRGILFYIKNNNILSFVHNNNIGKSIQGLLNQLNYRNVLIYHCNDENINLLFDKWDQVKLRKNQYFHIDIMMNIDSAVILWNGIDKKVFRFVMLCLFNKKKCVLITKKGQYMLTDIADLDRVMKDFPKFKQ